MGDKNRYIGDEALTKRLVLDLDWPVDKGRIKDIDDMEVKGFTETTTNLP